MCCFSPVPVPASLWRRFFPPRVHVSATSIFARMDGAEQVLVYSMKLSVAGEVAMILPVPVAPGAGEDALRFVNMEKRPRFFDSLRQLFDIAQPLARKGGLRLGLLPVARPRLVVHEVGAFVASYVPSRDDFDRL